MNCLIYVPISGDKHAPKDLSILARIAAVKEYARIQGWDIIDYVSDVNEVDCADDARLINIRSYINTHSDLDVVIAVVTQPLSIVDHTALKGVASKCGTRLVVITFTEDDNKEGGLPTGNEA